MSKIILVLGMHRSGTSCLTGCLQENGVNFPNVSIENKYNKKGNRENNEVMMLNDEILLFNNSTWDKPLFETLHWNLSHEHKGRAILAKYGELNQSQYIGFKDPRFIFTIHFWMKLIESPVLVASIRSPYAVAQSLNRRDVGFSVHQGLDLWLAYNNQLLAILKKNPFPLISFDSTDVEYTDKLSNLMQGLQLEPPYKTTFFETELRVNGASMDGVLDKRMVSCYHDLTSYL